jgi:hypothetical protein
MRNGILQDWKEGLKQREKPKKVIEKVINFYLNIESNSG